MLDKKRDLCVYRLNNSIETLETAQLCLDNKRYKDSINRSYYAVFYAVKAVIAMGEIDFKRHKDVVAYFNKNYVASGIFEKSIGRKLAHLQQKREASDYDDFFIASSAEAEEQYTDAEQIVQSVEKYLKVHLSIE